MQSWSWRGGLDRFWKAVLAYPCCVHNHRLAIRYILAINPQERLPIPPILRPIEPQYARGSSYNALVFGKWVGPRFETVIRLRAARLELLKSCTGPRSLPSYCVDHLAMACSGRVRYRMSNMVSGMMLDCPLATAVGARQSAGVAC